VSSLPARHRSDEQPSALIFADPLERFERDERGVTRGIHEVLVKPALSNLGVEIAHALEERPFGALNPGPHWVAR
jgi:hypothetical protein